jgi:hypothetical protein
MSKANTDVMDKLHGLVAKKLIEKIESGEATAADYGVAIKFLKDNSVLADPSLNETLGKLQRAMEKQVPTVLPFPVSKGN